MIQGLSNIAYSDYFFENITKTYVYTFFWRVVYVFPMYTLPISYDKFSLRENIRYNLFWRVV